MTTKRYVLDEGLIYDNGKEMEDVVDVLNFLSEENKQLKEQLEMCKDARQAYKQDWKACVSYCDTYKDEIHALKDNIQGLIEENKQLKSRVDDLKYQLNYVTKCKEMCFKDIEILDKKYEKLYDENKELKDKNSRLQETLAFRSNQLALMEQLIDDLGSEEMARQMELILND